MTSIVPAHDQAGSTQALFYPFYLGCAVWAFPGWLGDFYPKGSKPADFLPLYQARFNSVEGNTSFYVVPSAATIARWVSQTTPDFHFCLKLHRDITHRGLLMPHRSAIQTFQNLLIGLGDRLGVTFAQLPPSYAPTAWRDLQQFLQLWTEPPDRALPLAIEVRHPAWFLPAQRDRLNQLLSQTNVSRVLLDTRPIYATIDDPQKHSQRRKPQLPLHTDLTHHTVLVRFISHPDPTVNEPFLTEWVDRVAAWLVAGIRVYFFVHCPQEARSPYTARDFYQRLAQRLTQRSDPGGAMSAFDRRLPPLGWQVEQGGQVAIEPPSEQLTLFS